MVDQEAVKPYFILDARGDRVQAGDTVLYPEHSTEEGSLPETVLNEARVIQLRSDRFGMWIVVEVPLYEGSERRRPVNLRPRNVVLSKAGV